MSTTEKLPVIIRPNGKPYRPRTLTAGTWENDRDDDDCSGCFVLGTHDVDLARPLAEEECRFAFGVQYAVKPEMVWIRDGFESGERRWVHDAVRGRAAVRFVASDDPEEEIECTDATVAIVGDYYRSRSGSVIHLAPCPQMGAAGRWSYADGRGLRDVAAEVRGTGWLRLCKRCWPAAALGDEFPVVSP